MIAVSWLRCSLLCFLSKGQGLVLLAVGKQLIVELNFDFPDCPLVWVIERVLRRTNHSGTESL